MEAIPHTATTLPNGETTADRDRRIAETILGQLPRMWAAMISGKAVVTSMGVRITFKGCRKANTWIIQLDASDTYVVRFHKVGGGRWNSKKGEFSPVTDKMVAHHEGIYFDQLRSLFEDFTGLRLSL